MFNNPNVALSTSYIWESLYTSRIPLFVLWPRNKNGGSQWWQSTRLESYLQDVSHALGRKVSGIERAPYEVLNALHEHRQMQSFARRVWVVARWWGLHPHSRGKNKGKWSCRAVGERVRQLGLWTCWPGFQLQEANSLPWPVLSPAQPVRFLQLCFCLHQLLKPSLFYSPAVTGLPTWKTAAILFLNHFKSLEALHLHWVATAGVDP